MLIEYKIAAIKMDLKTAKLSLKVSKGGLTKAIGEFEKAIDQLNKNKDVATVTMSRKVRLAAGVMETLDMMNLKTRKTSEAKDMTI